MVRVSSAPENRWVRKVFETSDGLQMIYHLFIPPRRDRRTAVPFLISVSGSGQTHLNGFSRRLPCSHWAVAVPLRPNGAPLMFLGDGGPGTGVWYLREFTRHLQEKFVVDGGRFLFVGVSNGGNSVLRFATLWPELCCGLVVVTGGLKGLVEMPSALKQLRGIPIDMYVGTKDECGFFKPMVEMEADLRAIGHTPAATLTVFKDVGHVCSPQLDDYVLHSKIFMILLHAGTAGDSVRLNVTDMVRAAPEKVMAELRAFGESLGHHVTKDAGGGLTVSSAKGVSAHIDQPTRSMRKDDVRPDCELGAKVEVWSNSQKKWVGAKVANIALEGEGEGVTVTFEDERGAVSKIVPFNYVGFYLRKPAPPGEEPVEQPAGEQPGSAVDVDDFVRGDRVAIWSSSKKQWFKDGLVADVSSFYGGTVTVRFGGGEFHKIVPAALAGQMLKRLEPAQPGGPARLNCAIRGPSDPVTARQVNDARRVRFNEKN